MELSRIRRYCEEKDYKSISKILVNINPNSYHNGDTVFCYLCRNTNYIVIKYVLENFDVNVNKHTNLHPVAICIKNRDYKSASLLLETKRVNLYSRAFLNKYERYYSLSSNPNENTILDLIVLSGNFDLFMIAIENSYSFDINRIFSFKENLYHKICQITDQKKRNVFLDYCLSRGLDTYVPNFMGEIGYLHLVKDSDSRNFFNTIDLIEDKIHFKKIWWKTCLCASINNDKSIDIFLYFLNLPIFNPNILIGDKPIIVYCVDNMKLKCIDFLLDHRDIDLSLKSSTTKGCKTTVFDYLSATFFYKPQFMKKIIGQLNYKASMGPYIFEYYQELKDEIEGIFSDLLNVSIDGPPSHIFSYCYSGEEKK